MFCAGHAWTSLLDNLTRFLLNQHTTTKLFSKKDFKHSLICLTMNHKMLEHIKHKHTNIEAKFGTVLAVASKLLECLKGVKSRVNSGYYLMHIKDSTNIPEVFHKDVKATVHEVQHSILQHFYLPLIFFLCLSVVLKMTMEDAEDKVPDEQAETQSYSEHQAQQIARFTE
jgi:hypothetical protein